VHVFIKILLVECEFTPSRAAYSGEYGFLEILRSVGGFFNDENGGGRPWVCLRKRL